MKKNLKIASIFALLVLLWLASGLFTSSKAPTPNLLDALEAVSDSSLPSVMVEQIRSEPRNKSHILRGKTASQQTASISTEISGRVTSRPVARGARVEEGQILCEIATGDRGALVAEARAAVAQAEIEYNGALVLRSDNLLAEAQAAQLSTRLEAAKANLLRRELDLSRTKVKAPFSGAVWLLRGSGSDERACSLPMLLKQPAMQTDPRQFVVPDNKWCGLALQQNQPSASTAGVPMPV